MLKNVVKVLGFGTVAIVLAGAARASLKESGKALAPLFAGVADSLSEKIDEKFENEEGEEV